MQQEWVIQIKEQCIEQNVPFFFKQWGGVNKKKTGRILQGRTWDDLPFGISSSQNGATGHNNSFQQTARAVPQLECSL